MEQKIKKNFLDSHPRIKKVVENEMADAMSLRVKMCWIVAIMWVLTQLALFKIIFTIINKAITDVEMAKAMFSVMKDFFSWVNIVFLIWIIVYMLGKQNVHLKVLGLVEVDISNNAETNAPVKFNDLKADEITKENSKPQVIIPTGDTRTGD